MQKRSALANSTNIDIKDAATAEQLFDFALNFQHNSQTRIHAALTAINRLQDFPDGVFYTEPSRGTLTSTCDGHGLRVDLPAHRAEGYVEFIKVAPTQILMITDIRPATDIHYRIEHDAGTYLGIQLSREEEQLPWVNAGWEDVIFVGKYAQPHYGLAAKGSFPVNKRYVRLVLCMAASENQLDSPVSTPGIDKLISEACQEVTSGKAWFSHFKASIAAKRCAHELLSTAFEGRARLEYSRIKLQELLLYVENHCLHADHQTRSQKALSAALRTQLMVLHNEIINKPCADYALTQLADSFGLAESRLNAAYKTLFDVSIHQFVMEQRMNFAKQQLEQNAQPVSEIARRVGYSDPSGFTRAFVKHYGVTPGKIRSNRPQ